jgi:molybdopterin-binding protein
VTFVLVACLIVGVIAGGAFAVMRIGAAAGGDDARAAALEGARTRLAAGARELRDRELATVVGVVRAAEPLEAPLSGRACVAYSALLRVDVPGTPGRPIEERAACAFELEVGEARYAVVTTAGGAVEIAQPLDPIIPGDRERNARFVAKAKVKRVITVGAAYEAVVAVGARVAVSAMVMRERAVATGEAGYRDEADVVKLVDSDGVPIVIGPA